MPSSAQIREERLAHLFKEFNGKNVTTVDAIYQRALDLFPYVSNPTAKDYAKAVLRMLKMKKKEEKWASLCSLSKREEKKRRKYMTNLDASEVLMSAPTDVTWKYALKNRDRNLAETFKLYPSLSLIAPAVTGKAGTREPLSNQGVFPKGLSNNASFL